MLAVRPPFHQEFRARQALCSPGDGWRAYKPPPPLSLGTAFHFLSSLLEPDAYSCTESTAPRLRPAMDKRLHGKLQKALHMPIEVLCQVVENVMESAAEDGVSLTLSCRFLNQVATPFMYRSIVVRSAKSIASLNQTLERHPHLGAHLQELCFDMQRLPWQEMNRLCINLSLQGHIQRVKSLVFQGMPASDLHQALPFLKSFSPIRFTWSTSPCWQMRPAALFVDFIASWPKLQCLTLQNFQFDETLLRCIESIPSLRALTLGGSGTERMESQIVQAALTLQKAPSAHFIVNVRDCSIERRSVIESELVGCDYCSSRLVWS